MEVNMINFLVGNSSVVLQHVVAFALGGVVLIEIQHLGQFLHHRQQIREIVVGNVVQLCAMSLWDNKAVGISGRLDVQKREGVLCLEELERGDFTLDDFAEDARSAGRHGGDSRVERLDTCVEGRGTGLLSIRVGLALGENKQELKIMI